MQEKLEKDFSRKARVVSLMVIPLFAFSALKYGIQYAEKIFMYPSNHRLSALSSLMNLRVWQFSAKLWPRQSKNVSLLFWLMHTGPKWSCLSVFC
jgi:hypothetical protein